MAPEQSFSAEDRQRLRAAADYKLGMALLSKGLFDEGWRLYDDRLKLFPHSYQAILSPAPSSPADFTGKHVLILGDPDYTPAIAGAPRPDLRVMSGGFEIMFAQYLPKIFAHKPDSLTVLADSRLCSLLQRSFSAMRFVARADAIDEIAGQVKNMRPLPDIVLPEGSLGRVFIKTRGDVPAAEAPWLAPDANRVPAFRAMLRGRAAGRLPVALSSWSAGIEGKSAHPAEFFRPFAVLADRCLFVNMQETPPGHPVGAATRQAFRDIFRDKGIADLPFDSWNDIEGCAALLAAIRDEGGAAVMIPNYVEQLACGTGIATFKLLHGSYTPDYGYGRVWNEDLFIYPWTRTYLQDVPGEWGKVFAEVAADLARYAAGERNIMHCHDVGRFKEPVPK